MSKKAILEFKSGSDFHYNGSTKYSKKKSFFPITDPEPVEKLDIFVRLIKFTFPYYSNFTPRQIEKLWITFNTGWEECKIQTQLLDSPRRHTSTNFSDYT